jgi:hypothetical protein
MTLIATLPFIGCDDARRRPRSIRARLMQIVFTLVVPGAIGFIILASSFYRHERDHIAQSTLVTARALVSAVDRDLVSTTVAAQILALSPNLQSEDFAAFHSEASKLIPLVFGSNFALADESGQQLVNTLTPMARRCRATRMQQASGGCSKPASRSSPMSLSVSCRISL